MNNKKIVYTSFDGDDMIHIDHMRELAIKNGYISINPEHALGYYLSTTTMNNKKREVMKDCLSLVMMCDDFWIFNRNNNLDLDKLSEGIITEMLLWIKVKNNIFNICNISELIKSLRDKDFKKDEIFLNKKKLKERINSRSFSELSYFLKSVYKDLRPVVFIDMPDKDLKYADWARKKAFNSNKVPLIPQHVITSSVYKIHNIYDEYYNDSLKLANKAAEIWGIYSNKKELEIMKKKYYHKENISFISTKELKIPKYNNAERWCLTSKEKKTIKDIAGLN